LHSFCVSIFKTCFYITNALLKKWVHMHPGFEKPVSNYFEYVPTGLWDTRLV
jgi:hypothetical protein